MNQKCFILIITLPILLQGCKTELQNSWQARPFINAFGEEAGSALFIEGEELSEGLSSAQVSFNLTQDLISGGYKQVFTFTLNGNTSGSEIEVLTPTNESYVFELYDGLIFNIDYESNEISRFIELMNYEFLILVQGEHQFTISTRGFVELYKEKFLQPNS